jgi:hypothetical protein
VAQFYADRVALGSHRAKTPEGYLIALGVPICRTGWQTYTARELELEGDPNAKIDVYRSEDEVFAAPTIASFEGKSVTSPHPPRFLTKDNDGNYAKGHAQNIRKGDRLPDGNYAMLADLVIKDPVQISQVENDINTEVSAGYSYELEPMPNEHSANAQFRQANIRGNHVALVNSGRAGKYVRVLDSQPEEGKEVVMDEVKSSAGFFTEMKSFLSSFGLKLSPAGKTATDAEPETVEHNREYNEKALERAKRRNEDSLKTRDADKSEEELEKEEKKAVPPKEKEEGADKKKSKDTGGGVEEKGKEFEGAKASRASDSVDRLCGLVEKLLARDAKKSKDDDDAKECTCDAKKGEAHDDDCPMARRAADDDDDDGKRMAADDELIPVETLKEDEIPKNPIPGHDAKKLAIDALKRIAPAVAATGDRQAIDALNKEYRQLRGKKNNDASYGAVLSASSRQSKRAEEHRLTDGNGEDISDSRKQLADDFVSTADQYLGKDVGTVKVKKEAVN